MYSVPSSYLNQCWFNISKIPQYSIMEYVKPRCSLKKSSSMLLSARLPISLYRKQRWVKATDQVTICGPSWKQLQIHKSGAKYCACRMKIVYDYTRTKSRSCETNCALWRHQMDTFSALLDLCAGKSPVTDDFPSQGQWRGALMFSLICAWINGWVNNHEAGGLKTPSRLWLRLCNG